MSAWIATTRKNADIPDKSLFLEQCFEGPFVFVKAKDIAIPSFISLFFRLRKKELATKPSSGLVVSRLASDNNHMTTCIFCVELFDRHDLDVTFGVVGLDLSMHCY